jgi:hypothetical protein
MMNSTDKEKEEILDQAQNCPSIGISQPVRRVG